MRVEAQIAATGVLAEPREYLRAHNLITAPQSQEWASAIEILGQEGDNFSFAQLGALEQASLSEGQAHLVAAAMAAISERIEHGDAMLEPSLAAARLERAAYADLMCDRLEGVLPRWTFETLALHLNDPGVEEEVRRMTTSYTPTWDLETLFSSMSERVPSYARRVLDGRSVGEQ